MKESMLTASSVKTAMSSNPSPVFELFYKQKKVDVDYTPQWGRGNPNNYIDNLTFPKVLTDKTYKYRIVKGSSDLGVKEAYQIQSTGAQRINILEWNSGYGIDDKTTIKVYVVDPTDNSSTLIAQWN
jgi:hypothetical protein